jgi:hypothetical protein
MLNLHSIIANEKRFPLNVIKNGLLKWYDIMIMMMIMMMLLMDSPYHVYDNSNFNKLLKMGCCSYDTATINLGCYFGSSI